MLKESLESIIVDIDILMDMFKELHQKTKQEAEQSEDVNFKRRVNQYEILLTRLIDYELVELYTIANNRVK